MTIIPLFGVPVLYIFETGRMLSKEESRTIENLEKITDNRNNLSKNTQVLDLSELKNLKSFCQDALDNYVKNVCGVGNDFYITNSWTTRNRTGIDHHKHNHPNSIFSGIYYIEAKETTAPLILHSQSPIFKNFLLDYNYTNYTIFNSNDWSFPVKTGSLIIFPSWVEHSSSINEDTNDRIILGFNSFVKGKFGSTNYCSDLTIL